MKALKRIRIEVSPVDNGGYLVESMAEVEREQDDFDSGAFDLQATFARAMSQRKQTVTRMYAPDSRRVAYAIQDIIDKATIEAAS